MNLAGVWKLPILFVCENNCWAGAQRPEEHCATPNIFLRAKGYNMPGESVDGNDVEAVYNLSRKLSQHCRSGSGPAFMEALTYRMRGHGEQDRQHYVDPKELAIWAKKCPIVRYGKKLLDEGILNTDQIEAIDQEATTRVEAAVMFGDASPYPGPETALTDVFVHPLNT
jgi:TPP-dependent pyruvate/acetoin dehydrogenase alpha subunit